MKLHKLITKITIILVLFALPMAWLVTTNSGLNTALSIASLFSPIKFNYRVSKGTIIGAPVEILDLALEYQGEALQVADLIVDWRLRTFIANNVRGFAKFLPKSDLLADQQLMIDKVQGSMQLIEQQQTYIINLVGKSAHAAIEGVIHATHDLGHWNIQYINLQVGKNTATVKQQLDHYSWDLKIVDPQVIFAQSSGALHAQGVVQNLQTAPSIKANVVAKSFVLQDYKVKDLQGRINLSDDPSAPLDIDINASTISMAKHTIKNLKVSATGSRIKHTVHANAIYDNNPLILTTNAQIQNAIWQGDALGIKINQEQLNGNASYDLKKNSTKLALYSSTQNYLTATLSLKNNSITGEAQVIANDLAFLMQWMPDVTRLKGKFIANAKISGSISDPSIIINAHLTEITATLPRYGVKIKPLEMHVVSDKHGRFTLTGKGKMRRGPGSFTFNGYIEPFKANMPNTLNIIGEKVEFINNQTAHLIASNKINLNYVADANRLDITGDIEIHEGHITIQDRSSQTVKSKDVVYVNEINSNNKNAIAINPHINLRIVEGVKFTGFDLYADISGKLNITRRNDTTYADGRITIKEGTFQLPGQKLLINKGRILYPPGTLLVNPVLDIKMYGKSGAQESIQGGAHDVELAVQGTANKPIISESGLTGKQDRAISTALLTGSSMLSKDLIQDKLKISEIGVTGDDEHNVTFFDAPSKDPMRNKNLVVGRPLGKRLYLQYLHSIGEANQKVRIKYSLNRFWAIGVESGTEGGGADLSFSIER